MLEINYAQKVISESNGIPNDKLSRLVLINNSVCKLDLNSIPPKQYSNVVDKYFKLKGPYNWRSSGQCHFSVALLKEPMLGDEKMYKYFAEIEKRKIPAA